MATKLRKKQKMLIVETLKGKKPWAELSRDLKCTRQGSYVVVAQLFRELVLDGKIKNITKLIK